MSLHKYLSYPPGLHLDFFTLDLRKSVPLLFPTICSFLNTEGGTIIIGVSRDKEYQHLEESSLSEFIVIVKERSEHHKEYLNPSYGFNMKIEVFEDNHLLVIEVPRSPILHKSGESLYKRVGKETMRVSEPQEVMEFYASKRKNTVSEMLPLLTKEDLNMELVTKAKAIARIGNSTHQWLSMSDDEIINGSNLSEYDAINDKMVYSLAAALIFGKDETIRKLLPSYKLDIFVRKVDTDRWDDRKTFITNLIDTQTGSLNFIKEHLPEAFYQDGAQRMDLRDLIFREIIGNVIIHREYSNALPTEIIIYKDRIEATNPNIIYKKGLLELGKFRHYPKNPLLRKFFNDLGWADEAGSGVRNVTKFLNIYVKGAIPLFIEDEIFTTSIPLKSYHYGDRSSFLLDLFGIAEDILDDVRSNLLKELSINPEIDEKDDKVEFINGFMGTLVRNEGKLVGFKIMNNNMLEKESYKKEGTLLKKDGNLIVKKGGTLIRTLIGLLVEKTLEEVTIFAGFGNKESFRDNYLSILRKNELITLTIPDNPHDPNQKYIITEKGKKLLGGIDVS